MRSFRANPDLVVARIATRQHGVVSLAQLLWAGLSRHAVKRRVAAGRLHRLHRGVYAVGHTDLRPEGRLLAAVFACGPGAVLSHESAAYLWGFTPRCRPLVDVTIPTRNGRRRRQGIRLHYRDGIDPAATTKRLNIPVTTPRRTRGDLGWGHAPTRSGLERRFLSVLRDHGIPEPETNVPVGPYTVDCLWRAEALVVELDSYAYHSDRATFTADRARDRDLARRGLEIHRFADDEVDDERAVAESVRALLRARRARR